MRDAEPSRKALALWFAVEGDLKYLSHRDALRFWQRAFTRAGTPVRFSQGFNPHMRLSLPLPRNVGVESRCELIVAELAGPVDLIAAVRAIGKELPPGIRVCEARILPVGKAPQPRSADYRITLTGAIDIGKLTAAVERFVSAESVPVHRKARGKHPQRTFDLRPGVARMEITETNSEVPSVTIGLRILIDRRGTARLDEILNATGIDDKTAEIRIIRESADYGI